MQIPQIDFRKFHTSLQALTEAFSRMGRTIGDQAKMMTESNKHKSKRQMTKRGAVHKVNPTFLSRQIMPVTPAQYRRAHMGVMQRRKLV